MLDTEEQERLDKFIQHVATQKLRFPVASIAERTEFDKGYISKCLKGKKPLSDNFLKRFYEEFPIAEVPSIKLPDEPVTNVLADEGEVGWKGVNVFWCKDAIALLKEIISEKEKIIQDKELIIQELKLINKSGRTIGQNNAAV